MIQFHPREIMRLGKQSTLNYFINMKVSYFLFAITPACKQPENYANGLPKLTFNTYFINIPYIICFHPQAFHVSDAN